MPDELKDKEKELEGKAVEGAQEDDSDFDDAFAEFAGGSDDAAEEDGQGRAGEQVNTDDDDAGQAAQQQPKAKAGESGGREEKGDEKDRRIKELEHQVRSQVGRVASLNQTLTKTREVLNTLKSPPQKAAAKEGEVDKWERLKEEFPELADAVDNRLASVNETVQRATSAITHVSESVNPILERELGEALTEQYKTLESKHEDWEDIVFGEESETYQAWLKEQPVAVQGLVKSQDARDAIFLLDAYKASPVYGQGKAPSKVGQIRERRKQQLKNAAGVVSRKVGHAPEAGATDDFDSAFDFYARQKEKNRSRHPDII